MTRFLALNMDVCILYGVLLLLIRGSEAINCHDCTSWSPYCREAVDEPFPAAVATSECTKTDTCFLKKEESGVITRGCADWWMQSQVDINYIGCQTQEVPWMGKQTWCFCQEDYCNGGTVEEIIDGIGHRLPRVHDELAAGGSATAAPDAATTTGNGWNQDWESIDWNQWTWNENTGAWESSELNALSELNDAGSQDAALTTSTLHSNEFNDFHQDYQQEHLNSHSDDPSWNLWYWHADSDRPQWPTNEAGGKNMETMPTIAAEPETTTTTTTTQAVRKADAAAPASTEGWDWGEGWEQLLPWWEGTFYQSTTMPPVIGVTQTVGIIQQHDSEGDDPSQIIDALPDVDWQQGLDNRIDSNEVDISAAEFFCWDCYSDSPLCGKTVDSTKAHYLGKTACPATNKCFVRHDGDVTYRGCADGWIGSVVKHDYVGCEVQKLWGKEVEWCFCTASLCNGDSMMDIQEKYLHSEPQVFKGKFDNDTVLANQTEGNSTILSRTTRSVANTTSKLPEKLTDQTTQSTTTSKKRPQTSTVDAISVNVTSDVTSTTSLDKQSNATNVTQQANKNETLFVKVSPENATLNDTRENLNVTQTSTTEIVKKTTLPPPVQTSPSKTPESSTLSKKTKRQAVFGDFVKSEEAKSSKFFKALMSS